MGIGEDSLKAHNAFAVAYSKEKDVQQEIQIDDSEVTVNICLGKEFTGSEI